LSFIYSYAQQQSNIPMYYHR